MRACSLSARIAHHGTEIQTNPISNVNLLASFRVAHAPVPVLITSICTVPPADPPSGVISLPVAQFHFLS
jgi:hypothetical protein